MIAENTRIQNKRNISQLEIQLDALDNFLAYSKANKRYRNAAEFSYDNIELGIYGEQKALNILNALSSNIPKKILQDISFCSVSEPDKTAQIDFILITDKIIFVIEVKNWTGCFTVSDGEVYQKDGNRKYGNPHKQNETHIERLKEVLSAGGFGDLRFENIVYWANDNGDIQFDGTPESIILRNSFYNSERLSSEIKHLYNSAADNSRIDIDRISDYIYNYCEQNKILSYCPICKAANKTQSLLSYIPNAYDNRKWTCANCGYAEFDKNDFAQFDSALKIDKDDTMKTNLELSRCGMLKKYASGELEKRKEEDASVFCKIVTILTFAVAVFSLIYFITLKPCMMCREMGLYRFTERLNELFHDYYINGFGKNTIILLVVLLLIGSTGFLTGYMGNSLRNLHGGYFLRDKIHWELPVLLKYLPTFFMILFHSIYAVWYVFIDKNAAFTIPKYQISLIGENYTVCMWITQICVILALVSFIPIFIYAVIDAGVLGSLATIPVLIVSNCAMSIVMSLLFAVITTVLSYAAVIIIGLIIVIYVSIILIKAVFLGILYR